LAKRRRNPNAQETPVRLSSDAPHAVEFFRRHPDDDPTESAPGYEFIESCPNRVGDKILAVLKAVLWEAMHDDMTGWYEVRADGGKPRQHHRVFCRLDTQAAGVDRPILAVIAGMSKDIGTEFSDADYAKMRDLGDEYFSRNPRSLVPD
jgi:hypothetical protein